MAVSILVVEDDEDLRLGLLETLEDAGYAVRGADSGEDAVELVKLGYRPELLLTDIRMAGMDGLTAFEELKRMVPGLHGVIMTGYASDEAPARAVRSGAWDYLYKPFREEELLETIRAALGDEARQERDQALVSRVLGEARSWLRSAMSGLALKNLERLRRRTFQAFFVGVRSRLLDSGEGLLVWDQLERLDRDHRRSRESGREAQEVEALAAEYRRVAALIAGLTKDQLVVYHDGPRSDGQISRSQFTAWWERIRTGQVSAHLLPMAPFLRCVEVKAGGELAALVAQVWGEG